MGRTTPRMKTLRRLRLTIAASVADYSVGAEELLSISSILILSQL